MAELRIPEVILSERKKRNMTQEELAAALGVSPQAVSNWERGGYPDITMLPSIANYFELTIDELLGNDDVSKELAFNKYYETATEADRETNGYEAGLKVALEYHRKYPNDFYYMYDIVWRVPMLSRDEREQYLPVMRECCENIIDKCTYQGYREEAIRSMCITCDDEEFDKWYRLGALDYKSYSDEMRELRLWDQGKHDASRRINDLNNLAILLHFLFRDHRNWAAPEKSVAWHEYRIRMVEFLAEGGEIPQAWCGVYAYLHFAAACSSFGCGRNEAGYAYIEKTFELYPKWFSIPDQTPMEVGNFWVFGGMKIIKNGFEVVFPDGEKQTIRNYCYMFHDDMWGYKWMYHGMTAASGWEWFDGVREEDRFREYVERARVLAEAETNDQTQ